MGRYDVQVEVGTGTVDGKPVIYEVKSSRFSSHAGGGSTVGVTRSGTVQISDQEEAFKRGVPFFIYDVKVQPTGIQYTVASNPRIAIDGAVARIEVAGDRIRYEIMNTPKPFSSQAELQKRFFERSGPFDGKALLSVVTLIDQNNGCTASNEVDLASAPHVTPSSAPTVTSP